MITNTGSLGSLLSANADTKDRVNKANDIINACIWHVYLGAPDKVYLRTKWYEVLNANPKSTIESLINSFNSDVANPSITNVNGTALGKYIAGTLVSAFKKAGWGIPLEDPGLLKLGAGVAYKVYSVRAPEALSKFQTSQLDTVTGMPLPTQQVQTPQDIVNQNIPSSLQPVADVAIQQVLPSYGNSNQNQPGTQNQTNTQIQPTWNNQNQNNTQNQNFLPGYDNKSDKVKSNTLLYVGLGVGLIALVVAGIVMAKKRK
jgi:hypothetical protein